MDEESLKDPVTPTLPSLASQTRRSNTNSCRRHHQTLLVLEYRAAWEEVQ